MCVVCDVGVMCVDGVLCMGAWVVCDVCAMCGWCVMCGWGQVVSGVWDMCISQVGWMYLFTCTCSC